jgi:prepilin-type N-terminal cleavage/methylation domain-containing protein
MKRGFTLLEIIFVIVIIGILSSVLLPRFTRPTLREAANQIVSHIQYTQHLAMIDNKFDAEDEFWYRSRWQIQFRTIDSEQCYMIYSNMDGSGSNAVQGDLARNPLNSEQFLTGQKNISTNTGKYNKNMNLTQRYNISSVIFSNSCSYRTSRRVSFDYLGRPLYGNPVSLDQMYIDGVTGNRLIRTPCVITLIDGDGNNIDITIESETGYVHTS